MDVHVDRRFHYIDCQKQFNIHYHIAHFASAKKLVKFGLGENINFISTIFQGFQHILVEHWK